MSRDQLIARLLMVGFREEGSYLHLPSLAHGAISDIRLDVSEADGLLRLDARAFHLYESYRDIPTALLIVGGGDSSTYQEAYNKIIHTMARMEEIKQSPNVERGSPLNNSELNSSYLA